MSIPLEKRTEKVTISLRKRGILLAPMVRVGLALDLSGSAQPMYKRTGGRESIMSATTDRILAVADKFDDNHEMDMWGFTTQAFSLAPATVEDYGTYVDLNIMENASLAKWGGTSYAPVLSAMADHYFRTSASPVLPEKTKGLFGMLKSALAAPATTAHTLSAEGKLPALGILITDGKNNDPDAAEALFRSTANLPIYWLLVGVGPAHEFEFIERMGKDYPNVGFANLESLDISDEDLYDQVITDEFCTWIKTSKIL